MNDNDPMTCVDAQDRILQRLDEPLPEHNDAALDAHVRTCADCTRFAEQQLDLDARLCLVMPPMKLGPDFRAALRRRIAAEPKQPWINVLPDYAHLAGCAIAMAVTVGLFPAHTSVILTIGTFAAALTYLAQTMLASALDEMEMVG